MVSRMPPNELSADLTVFNRDEEASFRDVSPADCLRVAILDRRLFGPHLLLGSVSAAQAPCSRLRCDLATRGDRRVLLTNLVELGGSRFASTTGHV